MDINIESAPLPSTAAEWNDGRKQRVSLPHRLTNTDTSNLITRPSSALTGTGSECDARLSLAIAISLSHSLTLSFSLFPLFLSVP